PRSSTMSTLAMTVCTYHVTLRDLSEEKRLLPMTDNIGDVILLVRRLAMIEVHHIVGIGTATISAGLILQPSNERLKSTDTTHLRSRTTPIHLRSHSRLVSPPVRPLVSALTLHLRPHR